MVSLPPITTRPIPILSACRMASRMTRKASSATGLSGGAANRVPAGLEGASPGGLKPPGATAGSLALPAALYPSLILECAIQTTRVSHSEQPQVVISGYKKDAPSCPPTTFKTGLQRCFLWEHT
jgi:hypothetical protein